MYFYNFTQVLVWIMRDDANWIRVHFLLRDTSHGPHQRLLHHQTYIDNCLNIRVLEVSIYDYIQSDGPIDDNEPIKE